MTLPMRNFANSRTTNTIVVPASFWRGGTGSEIVPSQANPEEKRTYTQLHELKRITGYSWTRISELLSCSRVSVHNWINGVAPGDRTIRDIGRMYDALAYIDRGSQADTKTVLEAEDGAVFKLLKNLDFERAKKTAGQGAGNIDNFWKGVVNKLPGQEDHWTETVNALSGSPLGDNEGFPARKVVGRLRDRKK
ncbi:MULTISPECIES: hypothetical protein [unclassified Rhizobium]|uniref:hypothetical protein n=1 Tax=unclassified Rhizobium TaxID=2613769 RepID=UPI001044F7D1|nr:MULTISPECIES: hypothetical protein [unclassified Rhizobium]MBB4170836.1 hypothetical protein [Rhizobium sp. BK538]TCM67871.1 hypothetical protein EV291_13230 [Rhizobium sp. BK068]